MPVNPKPTKPGEVVIIAGDYRNNEDPVDGTYAVQANASSLGGLAVGPDGSVYFPIPISDQGRIARVTPDGRFHILPFETIAKQIAVEDESLWLMSSYSDGFSLTRISMPDNKKTLYVGWHSQAGNNLKVVPSPGKAITKKQRQELEGYWANSVFSLRSDGAPIIASSRGELFESLGDGKLQRWDPPGYKNALDQIAKDQQLKPLAMSQDGNGGLAILGRSGIVRIPSAGTAQVIKFPPSTANFPPWSSMAPLDGGSILLLGGVSAMQDTPRPTRVLPNGTLELLPWGSSKRCDEFDGTLSTIGSLEPGGAGRRPDGSIVVSDRQCDRVYAFRPPNPLSGSPYPG
jgi:hypothetical protein